MEMTKERVSEIEDRSIGSIQSEQRDAFCLFVCF